jgi:hypothetical protein
VDVLHGTAVVGGFHELPRLFALEFFEFGSDEESGDSDCLQDGLGNGSGPGEVVVQQDDSDLVGLTSILITSLWRLNSKDMWRIQSTRMARLHQVKFFWFF